MKLIICKTCGKSTPNKARSECNTCYARVKNKAYYHTPGGKAVYDRYINSPKGIEARKRAQKKYYLYKRKPANEAAKIV